MTVSPEEFTDVGNASRFVAERGEGLRYVAHWGRWLVDDGTRWVSDQTGVEMEHAKALALHMMRMARHDFTASMKAFERAMALEDHETAKLHQEALAGPRKMLAHAVATLKRARLEAMVALARSAPELAITHEQLDANPWLFNVANGTVDLRTGKLRPHRREDLITKLAPILFDERATCPTWLTFLDHALAHDQETIDFLARFVGYALTGAVTDHVLLFLYGPGGTGKSTFFNVMHELLGDYAVRAPRKLLFASRGERHETELTTLFGARFVSCNEVDEGARFDEGLVKDLTGGEAITARRMREDHWTFRPTHKLIVAGNHKPVVRSFDDAIRRRLRLVPFVVKPATADRELADRLRGELPGILAWAARGCLAWQRDGLGEPATVRAATDEYQSESDPLGEFFNLHCVFEPDARIARAQLREAYVEYCAENGALPLAARNFAKGLRARGVENRDIKVHARTKNGWRGVRLATDAERDRRQRRYIEGTDSGFTSYENSDSNISGYTENGSSQVPTADAGTEDWTGVVQ